MNSCHIEADYLDDVVSFTQSSSPTHDIMDGCVHAEDDTDLSMRINESSNGDEIRLCPGTIHFTNEIVLEKSITINCAGTKGSCILDGNEATRHFLSDTAGLTFTFIDLVLINGFVDDDTEGSLSGGSLFFLGSGSTIIIDGSLFYNNRAISSTGSSSAVSIIFI